MRVFSGLQPTGRLHLGNYLGVIRPLARLGAEAQCLVCVADLHALTGPSNPHQLAAATRSVAALHLAAGIDPGRVTLFVQSHVAAHAELNWLLGALVGVGELSRMTQYKVRRQTDARASLGLFAYPVLMAADILLYSATHVPVGADQRQHVEFARTLVRRFNRVYGPTFPLPVALVPDLGARVMALDDPRRKMSKSALRDGGRINLLDSPDVVRAKIAAAVTDADGRIRFAPAEKPGVSNLLVLYAALADHSLAEVEGHFAASGYAALKSELAEQVIDTLAPIQARYRKLVREPSQVDAVLAAGAARAGTLAAQTLPTVRQRMGLLPPLAKSERPVQPSTA